MFAIHAVVMVWWCVCSAALALCVWDDTAIGTVTIDISLKYKLNRIISNQINKVPILLIKGLTQIDIGVFKMCAVKKWPHFLIAYRVWDSVSSQSESSLVVDARYRREVASPCKHFNIRTASFNSTALVSKVNEAWVCEFVFVCGWRVVTQVPSSKMSGILM